MATAANLLAGDLDYVLDGTVSLEEVLDNPAYADGPLTSCFHGLQHFLADAGLRAKDSAYRQMQEAELRKLILLLRSGADESTLRKISFLGVSDVQTFLARLWPSRGLAERVDQAFAQCWRQFCRLA